MIRAHLLILPALLWLASALPSTAQSFQPKTIQFKGASEYTDAELLSAAGLKKGTALTGAEMNEHTKQLMDSNVFDNITFTFNGQDLVFQIIPSTMLYPLRFENLPLENGKDLETKLHAKLPLYHGKVPLEGGLLDQVRKALEEELASKNIQATLTTAPYTDQATNKYSAIVVTVSSPAIRVGDIQLAGASPAMDAKAHSIVAKFTDAPYSAEGSVSQLETSLDNYYHELGYLQATAHAVARPTYVVYASSVHIPFDIRIDEGPQYKLTAAKLASDIVVTQADFDKQSGLHMGEIVSPDKVRENLRYLTRQYRNKGLMKAKVIATATYDRAQGTVSYLFTADPGPVYTMGTLKMLNASDELRTAVQEAWLIPAGATFNEGAIMAMTATHGVHPILERFFTNVEVRYVLNLHDDVRTVDVNLSFVKTH